MDRYAESSVLPLAAAFPAHNVSDVDQAQPPVKSHQAHSDEPSRRVFPLDGDGLYTVLLDVFSIVVLPLVVTGGDVRAITITLGCYIAIAPQMIARWRSFGAGRKGRVSISSGRFEVELAGGRVHEGDFSGIERYDHQGFAAVLRCRNGVTVSIPDGSSDGKLGAALRCNLPQGCLVAKRPASYWFLGHVPIPGIAALLLVAYGNWLVLSAKTVASREPPGGDGLLAIAAYGFALLWLLVGAALWKRRNGEGDEPVDWTREPLTLEMHRDAGAASPWIGRDLTFRLGARGARCARLVRAAWAWAIAAGAVAVTAAAALLWSGQTLAGNWTLACGFALGLAGFVSIEPDSAAMGIEGLVVRWSNGRWTATVPGGTPVGVREAEYPSTDLIVSVRGRERSIRPSWLDLDPPVAPPQIVAPNDPPHRQASGRVPMGTDASA